MSEVLKIAADQQTTKEWWNACLPKFIPCISEFVVREIIRGDAVLAKSREKAVRGFSMLDSSEEVESLARAYMKKLSIPKRSELDAYHLAIAGVHGVEFLVSWNCHHIANAFLVRPMAEINRSLGFPTTVVCTPRELIEV